ncbi:MAG: hypothetical protein U5R48_01290 [Gammaproteobacteria bacterium]|nr:hypothetical protein [Gammaproteobacteria bacterium]
MDAGVDGLVVEGAEGGGFKNGRDVSSMVLLPLVRAHRPADRRPPVALLDGRTMAAAFAHGRRWRSSSARAWCRRRSPRCTRTGRTPSSRRRRPNRYLEPATAPGPALRALRTEQHHPAGAADRREHPGPVR